MRHWIKRIQFAFEETIDAQFSILYVYIYIYIYTCIYTHTFFPGNHKISK